MNSEAINRLLALNLPAEAMNEVLSIIADTVSVFEAKAARVDAVREKDRARKSIHGKSTEIPTTIQGISMEVPGNIHGNGPPLARVDPNIKLLVPSSITESKKEVVDADASSTPKASALAIEGAFARLKAVYPERDGGDPSTPAKKKLTALLKGGVELEAILVGARNYAAEQAKLGHIKTPFVKQKVSWLHSRCWEDYQTTAALVPVHDPTADREPPPGMPTSAEIRKEIEERRANQERRNQELLRVGGSPHSREESGGEGPLLRGADVGRRQPDNPGVERLGTLLPLARVRTGANENGSPGRTQDDDHARPMAHLVRR